MNDIRKLELGAYYNDKAIKVNNTKKEIEILKEAVSKNVETPYTYNRLSILLIKEGNKKEALEVCKKYQKIMNKRLEYRKKKSYCIDISSKEEAIINRLKKLEGKK